jgi:hypothetical protein
LEELRTPTHGIEVEVHIEGTSPFRGEVFSPDFPPPTNSFSDLNRLLHDGRRFLPLRVQANSQETLFHKAHLLRLHMEDGAACGAPPAPDDAHLRASGPSCALLLNDGTRLAGELLVDAPEHAARLIDRLNHAREFVPLRTLDGFVFINRDCIVRVERGATCRS